MAIVSKRSINMTFISHISQDASFYFIISENMVDGGRDNVPPCSPYFSSFLFVSSSRYYAINTDDYHNDEFRLPCHSERNCGTLLQVMKSQWRTKNVKEVEQVMSNG